MTKLEALAKSRPSFTTMQISRFFGSTTIPERYAMYDEIASERTGVPPYYSRIRGTLANSIRKFPNDYEAREEFCLERLADLSSQAESMKNEPSVKGQSLTMLENNIDALKTFISCKGLEDLAIGKVAPEGKYATYSHSGEFFDVTFTPDALFWTPRGKRGLLVFRIKKEPLQNAQRDFILAMAVKYLEYFFPDDKVDRKQCGIFDVYADEFIHAGSGEYVNTWKSFAKTSKEIWPQLLKRYEAQEAKAA